MKTSLEIVAVVVLGIVALTLTGALVASFALHSDPDPTVLVGLVGPLGTSVGAIAGLVRNGKDG